MDPLLVLNCHLLDPGFRAPDEVGVAFCDGEIGATPTEEVGERSGLTGETAIERGTGDEERGVEPVGVVLPLAFF